MYQNLGDGRAVWMWRTDDPNVWVQYDAKVSAKIEAAYQTTGKDTIEQVFIDKNRYIDLRNLKQRHKNIPMIERDVKRETA